MTNELETINENLFESIKHINEYGQEYWEARELQPVLEYRQWRQFSDVIAKAMEACESSNINPSEHFADVRKTSPMPNGGVKEIPDFHLSRYACYLIVKRARSNRNVNRILFTTIALYVYTCYNNV